MHPLKIIFLMLVLFLPLVVNSQKSSPDSTRQVPDKEASNTERKSLSSPVVFDNDTLFTIYETSNDYPADFRAKQISRRLEELTKDRIVNQDSSYLQVEGEIVKVMYRGEVAFIVNSSDADYNQISKEALAQQRSDRFNQSLKKEKGIHLSTQEWLIRILYFVLALTGLIILLKIIRWLFRKINLHLSKFEKIFLKKRSNLLKYFIPKNTANIFVFFSNVVRFTLIIFVLLTYLPFMFSFFPGTEDIVSTFYGYIARPVKFVFFGFIDFLPNLIFIFVIIFITRYFIRVQRDIVEDIEAEKFIIKGFPKDWASTTQKIISLLIWAFALVLIYPHLPGSTSPAFKGVSIFIGALISFGSTTAVANIVAGIVITYMRPYQIGDRVKIQDTVGDVVEKTLLVTRIRTPKNEDVTIPNANIINNHLVNYSANAKKDGLVVHTSITIGYDVHWDQVEKLLCDSALKSEYVLAEPKPFVLQTSLDDYYVSYELNAYTREAKKLPLVYSSLHKNILETFNEAGVEILSPQYIAARDGNMTTVPSKLDPLSRSPFEKIVDHLTGKNQPVKVTKSED